MEQAHVIDPVEFRVAQAAEALQRRIPARFADAAADHPRVAEWVQRYLADPAKSPSLLLTGPTGVGKTRQAWGALRAVVMGRAKAGLGLVWRATSHPELNDELRPKPDGSHTWALEPYLNAELLFLDDLGAGRQTEWTGDSLHRLVDHRWSHCLPTVYATNLLPEQLVEAVGERVVSRLGGTDTVTVALKGVDRRCGGAA